MFFEKITTLYLIDYFFIILLYYLTQLQNQDKYDLVGELKQMNCICQQKRVKTLRNVCSQNIFIHVRLSCFCILYSKNSLKRASVTLTRTHPLHPFWTPVYERPPPLHRYTLIHQKYPRHCPRLHPFWIFLFC